MVAISVAAMAPPVRALSRKSAIVGVGETDFASDYKAERERVPGYTPPDVEQMVSLAFQRALDHANLRRHDIDGLAVSFIYGGPSPQDTARLLGVQPRHLAVNGNIMAGPLPVACAAIAQGKADTIAMIYCAASRAIGRLYGGTTYESTSSTPSSYYYYHPWGFSSQAAHWALMRSAYEARFGLGKDEMAAIAIQVRKHAMANPQAIMRKSLTVEDYKASRYIVRPMHLFDMCLVNDGAVCLIVSRSDKARDQVEAPVLVAGWGESIVKSDKLQAMIQDRLAAQMQDASAQALDMAGLALSDIDHFEGYDVSTMHLVNQIEGFGFAEAGKAIALCREGNMTVGGRIPTNIGGGNLSGAYMHGWSQVAEIVRQLMHQAGDRQIPNIRHSMSAVVTTGEAHPIVYAGTLLP